MYFEEEEDVFDGLLPEEVPMDVFKAYEESLERERGALWEETI